MAPADNLTCLRCGHTWTPRKKRGLPMECPRCKRYDWNVRRDGH